MNQILSVEQKSKNSSTLDIQTIIKIFSIAIIVMGAILLGNGSYAVYQNVSELRRIEQEKEAARWPEVTFNQVENQVIVLVQNNVAIDRIIYNFNGIDEKTVLGRGQREIETQIEVPTGNNILNMEIIDENGKSTKYNKEVEYSDVDTTKPIIELVVVGSKLNITARTETETLLSYITYRWNEQEETRIDATGDKKMIETSIDILQGTNTLTVVAVDANNNMQTQIKEFKGVRKPVIQVVQDGDKLAISITHESSIVDVKIVYNGRNIALTKDRLGKPEVSLRLSLEDGENTIQIEATSSDDTVETFNGICNYDG